ncbi:MAG: L-sorbosone dehydrogenase [Devosia sp.]|uniref:PQQ-dependent sugar dehydrogenase n=1 Tax=Devosia sp. TaxID=1871048 RepID=UPI002618CEC8|nr:PQQ-dependent sugar dehydrogenase [Devosia sp.]MDB5539251.1 L-sorbosone dehydrogenase [Devosia sp.]
MKLAVIAAVSTMALMSSGVVAQEATTSAAPDSAVLTGEAAFGDYTKDAPGVRRLIKPSDLVPPGVTQSASNAPGTVPMPQGAMPQVPSGFNVEMVVSGLTNPRAIRFAPNGDLFLANSEAGEVRVYRFANGGAKPSEESVYATGLMQPYGIAFYPAANPQWVYVAESNGLKRFAYKAGDLKSTAAPETLFDNINPDHHWTRDVVFSPDGKTMYYSVGSGSNVGDGTMQRTPEGGLDAWISGHPLGVAWGEEERRAAVLAYDPDGKNERYFATGLRNCAGMTLQEQTGDVWCVVNERDELGDNVPFDYATSVKDGAFYGWPWFYIGDNPDPRWTDTPRDDLKGKITIPDVLFQTHSAPLNITFYNSDAWGPDYKGDAFVGMHGSWNRNSRTGYKVVKLDFDSSGKPTGEYDDFATGFVIDPANVWGRPVGVAVAPDGSLFFSEDGSGTVWRVSKAAQ